jgi:nicotinamidase/pyrazinamidase
MRQKWGVIVTDVQGDFTEWKAGSLAVPDSDEGYVRSVEKATVRLRELGLPVFGTQDWHPPDHVSFADSHPGRKPFDVMEIDGRSQVLWPPHCVQGTENARVLIDNNLFLAIVKKAQNPALESYSAFQDEGGSRTEMDTVLKVNSAGKLILYGIATDYCVKATALDGVAAGYAVTVVEDLCRAVSPGTVSVSLDEMRRHGVRVVPSLDSVIPEIERQKR